MSFLTYVPLAISVGALLVGIYNSVRTGSWRHEDRIKALETKVSEHAVVLNDIPSKADLAEVRAEVRGLERTIAGVDAGVTRIEQFLMNGAGR